MSTRYRVDMAVDYAALRDAAQEALLRLLSGGAAVEWSEGGHRTKIADPDVLQRMIERFDRLAAESEGIQTFFPIVEADLP